ncbi:hypothetical protein J7E83_07985 [Arthrobacter sp. ISL-48]|uniref:hypothetical protein n=1 Tax=Arthrobacter sp. ISL-48 TaxID=2819110 RepID=UPI001BEBC4F1|nr:hypothetical protein [Arthrobacter sp. ISL-48]MBT2532065.1 hypothetical protein [Arthrobacter sp. ISL-48]
MGESKSIQGVERRQPLRRFPVSLTWIFGAIALLARLSMFPYVSEDATFFLLPWMQEFRDHGALALGGEFSNYNFPYLLLMYLASLLPLEPLYAIKLASLVGDLALALSIGALVRQFRPAKLAPSAAALIALFLPTVLMNAAMWGQCDSLYTSFLVLSLRSLLRNDGRGAWLFWAVALSFKLQSVFFLPALVLVSLRNRYSVSSPAIAAALWLVLSLPPMVLGRSFASTIGVYVQQTQGNRLVFGAANVFVWFPEADPAQGRWWGILSCGLVVALVGIGYWRREDSPEQRVLLVISMVAVCPLLLPQMHDRYFFAAEVMSLLLVGARGLRVVPLLFAGNGLLVYLLYFAGNRYALPLMIASVVQCFAAFLLLRALTGGSNPWKRAPATVNP